LCSNGGGRQGKREAPSPPLPAPCPYRAPNVASSPKESERYPQWWAEGVGAMGGVGPGEGLALALWQAHLYRTPDVASFPKTTEQVVWNSDGVNT